MKCFLLFVFGSLMAGMLNAQSPNTALDNTFGFCGLINQLTNQAPNFPTPTPYQFNKVLVLPDDKIMVSGTFRATLNGISYNYLARLNADGSLDPSFIPFTNAYASNQWSAATKVIPVENNKYLVCGIFTQDPGTMNMIQGIYRLNNDGSIDNTFESLPLEGQGLDMSGNPTGNPSCIYDMDILPDGKIVVGGNFHKYGNDSINHLAVLNPNGTLFNGFNSPYSTSTNDRVFSVLATDNNRIIAGTNSSFSFRILKSDGIIDTASMINLSGVAGYSLKFAKQDDGKIIIAGLLSSLPGSPSGSIKTARFNPDFTLDNSFASTFQSDHPVIGMRLLANGKILIAGNFTTINGTDYRKLVRLNADGTLDQTFEMNGNSFNSGGAVYSADVQSDGKIVLYHNLTNHQGNILQNNNVSCFIIRLEGDEIIVNSNIPAPPSNLTATPTNSILLNWQDNADNEDGFIIESANSASGPWMQIADLPENSNSYLHANLTVGQEYFYRVSAYNSFGTSVFSNTASAVDGATMINNLQLNTVNIYPNPATSLLTIDFLPNESTLILNDLQGRSIYSTQVDNGQTILNLSNIEKGIYFLRIIHNNNTITRSVIVQ